MALLRSLQVNIYKTGTDILRLCSASMCNKVDVGDETLKKIQESRKKEDMPVEMKNPFDKEKPQCILCRLDIEPNFRNVRLLSQFVSSYTGRVYGRHITGLCEYKQKRLEIEIKRAQMSGLMGVYVKDPKFLADPDLYDSSSPYKVL